MNDVIELFEGVKNVEFEGLTYVEEVQAILPVFTLTEPSVEEWNASCRISNTKAFIELVGRQPVDYDEVLTWVYSLIEDCKNKNQPIASELAVSL